MARKNPIPKGIKSQIGEDAVSSMPRLRARQRYYATVFVLREERFLKLKKWQK
jgi:hypothetical protein